MKKLLYIYITFAALTVTLMAQDTTKWITPTIKGYGDIHYDPSFALIPNKQDEYKVIFKITNEKEKAGVNSQLWHIARLVNLLGSSNVPKEHIHISAVISGGATPVVLNNEAYEKQYKKPNPNLELIALLKKAGVELYVCAQAASERHYDLQKDINKTFTVSLSALTTLIHFQQLGYALIP